MTDPRELLDALGAHCPFEAPAAAIRREDVAPQTFAALRAVLVELDFLDQVDLFAGPVRRLRTVITEALESS